MPFDRDAEQVAAYLRGLPPLPPPEALAGHERVFLRARLLARLASTRGPAPRSQGPLWVAGLAGPAAAGLALLALFAGGLPALDTARTAFGLAATSGLAPLVAVLLAAGLLLPAALVLPLLLSEE